jgi:glycosyltransferase involved in cell wall biosynthesis
MPGKVVHLTTVHRPLDVRIFEKQCRSLAAHGYEVVLVATAERDEVRDGVALRALPKPKGRLDRVLIAPWRAMAKALRERPDLVHFHDPELIPIGMLMRLLGNRVVYDVHENLPMDILHSKPYLPKILRRTLSGIARIVEGVAGRVLTGVVTVTETFAGRFPAGKTVVVQNYPLLEDLGAKSAPPLADRPNTLLFTGGFAPTRCAREMVDALEHLPNVSLIVAGPARSQALMDELSRKPGWSRVENVGMVPRDELSPLFARAKVGLVLNAPREDYQEISTNKLFEYMMARLPIVASKIPSWMRIVEEVGCGLIADTTDPKDLADKCRWLIEHQAEADAMAERGYQAARSRFHWGSEETKLLAFYRRLLD